MKLLRIIAPALLVLTLVACDEKDDTLVEEFPDWQERNEAYFADLLEAAIERNNAGDTVWTAFRSVMKPDSIGLPYEDYIVVERLERGTGSMTSPLYTDSVSVHYRGSLLPSTSYPEGYEFDCSYQGTFDPQVAVPATFKVDGGLIEGFSTALQYMHRGDYWRVYIPHQLGYGSATSTDIPAYSTLVFELRLVDFWTNKKGDRD